MDNIDVVPVNENIEKMQPNYHKKKVRCSICGSVVNQYNMKLHVKSKKNIPILYMCLMNDLKNYKIIFFYIVIYKCQ